MSHYILVTYASRAGTTEEIAYEIARVLRKQGATVDVKPIEDAHDTFGYTGVIVGSAIRAGQWLPEAIRFLNNNRDELAFKPTALFTVCMTLHENTRENRDTVRGYMHPLLEIVRPVSVGAFAGANIPERLKLIERFVLKVVGRPEGDFRDWEAIDDWANRLLIMME